MNASQEPDRDSVTSSIAAVRQAWLDAVRSGDTERLGAMVTDVVVVHGNGRCVRGRDEPKADFLKGFEAFAIEQNVSAVEVVVRGRWAFEIAEVRSNLVCCEKSTKLYASEPVAQAPAFREQRTRVSCPQALFRDAMLLAALGSEHAIDVVGCAAGRLVKVSHLHFAQQPDGEHVQPGQ